MRTFNSQAQGVGGCAVALTHAGVIPLVFHTDGGKLQIWLSILSRERTAVSLPGSWVEGGARGRCRLQGAGQLVGRLLRPRRDGVLLHSGLIHARLSCRDSSGGVCEVESRDHAFILTACCGGSLQSRPGLHPGCLSDPTQPTCLS